MKQIEFHTSPEGIVYYKESGKAEKRLNKFSNIVEPLAKIIKKRYPECYARLATIYKGDTFKMVDRFCRCNFGEHDLLTEDVENDIFNMEEVRCPLRGICADENIICKPKSIYSLPEKEKEVVDLFVNGYGMDEISDLLHKSPSTVSNQLVNVKKKFGVKNCREIIKVLRLGR